MRQIFLLIIVFLFQPFIIIAQKTKCNEIMKKEILNIELPNNKINFTNRGVKKILKYEINDTINILGIKFLVGDGNASYFPNMPILFIPNEMKGYCFYRIDHLNTIERDKILKAFSSN